MSKLKHCPRCGGEAICTTTFTHLFDSPGDVKECIRCTECGLTVIDDFGDATKQWNSAKVVDPKLLGKQPEEDDNPTSEFEKLEEAREKLIEELITSPLGQRVIKALDLIIDAIENHIPKLDRGAIFDYKDACLGENQGETSKVICGKCKHKYFKDMTAYCPYFVGPLHYDGYCHRGERDDG